MQEIVALGTSLIPGHIKRPKLIKHSNTIVLPLGSCQSSCKKQYQNMKNDLSGRGAWLQTLSWCVVVVMYHPNLECLS